MRAVDCKGVFGELDAINERKRGYLDFTNELGGNVDNKELVSEADDEKIDMMIIIIEWDKIMINNSECSTSEEMKDQIIMSGCKKIGLQHDDANKETFDKVVDVLKEIEKVLEIDVEY